ncbi:hypothetical protein GI582_25405 [Sulfitobacter sp. BDSS02]|uniref:cellulose biosynthesis cyclic di-GMP-binding regulatory protein BcsB n=1 Tax=Heliomarina sp. TaxID=2917556 RepID=UPI004058E1D9|nr:hypothetical protein [Sulfitobacter sp. BDSS02]MBR9852182.1 cellulose biosynthesis cyclic di-GMP-binding regulatory protein BcsB [Paracoccaceae bacterium]
MKVLAVCLAAICSLPSQSIAQAFSGETSAVPVFDEIEEGMIARQTTLAELGFQNGITFRQLSGSSELYIPVPKFAQFDRAILQLEIRHGATAASDRYLQVFVADRPVASQALNGTSGEAKLRIPLAARDASAGFIPIRINYSGAFSDRVCIDERASGDFLVIEPSSTMTLLFDARSVSTPSAFAELRPPDTQVVLDSERSLAELAAITRAAALFGAEAGRLSFKATKNSTDKFWKQGTISLEATASGTASEMTAESKSGYPSLRVKGSDPQIGLWMLASEWAGIANTDTSVIDVAGDKNGPADRLSLGAFNADLNARQLVSNENFLISFQSSDIPVGKYISGLDLHLAAALDPEGRGATASIFLNETLLASRRLTSGMPERTSFSIPEGLIGRDNLLRVAFQRQASGGECRFKPQGYPVQILPGSTMKLSDAKQSDEDFYSLRQSFGAGVQVVLDSDLDTRFDEVLPWFVGTAGSMIPSRATIYPRASTELIEKGRPFFIVSETNPGDSDPAISFDQGRVEIRDRLGDTIFAGADLSNTGVLQIVSRDGTRGLWLRPGNGPGPVLSPENPLVLDRGNLALIGQNGVILSTSTDRDSLIEVAYPDRVTIFGVLSKYRPWIVGGVWLLITLGVLMAFQRIYRTRRSQSGS